MYGHFVSGEFSEKLERLQSSCFQKGQIYHALPRRQLFQQ